MSESVYSFLPSTFRLFILRSSCCCFVVEGAFLRGDIFLDIPPLCEVSYALIKDVSPTPDQIMTKLVSNIYQGKLREHLAKTLADESNLEKYLQNVHTLYVKCVHHKDHIHCARKHTISSIISFFFRTNSLTQKLAIYKLGSDATFLSKNTKMIFQKYLDTYIE